MGFLKILRMKPHLAESSFELITKVLTFEYIGNRQRIIGIQVVPITACVNLMNPLRLSKLSSSFIAIIVFTSQSYFEA